MNRPCPILSKPKALFQPLALAFCSALILSGCATIASSRHQDKGVALVKQGKYEEAEKELREATRIDPTNYESLYYLGLALAVQKKYAEAESTLRRTIEVNPGVVSAYDALGKIYFEQERYDEATEVYRTAVSLAPSFSPKVFTGLGFFQLKKGLKQEAEESFRRAIELQPKLPEAHLGLGTLFLEQKKLTEAVAEFRQTIKLQPDFYVAYVNLGVALNEQGEHEEGIKAYEEAIRLNPHIPVAYHNLAVCYAVLGQKEKALQYLTTAVDQGYSNWPWLSEQDPEFDSFKDDPRLKDLKERVKKRWEEKQKKEGGGK